MSLERKDVRFKANPEDFDDLKAVVETDGKEIGEWCEEIVMREVHRRIREARLLVERTQRQGISGHSGEYQGTSGRARDNRGGRR